MTKMKLLTPKQVADQLGVQPRTVARWCRDGTIKGSKVGRVWRISEAEVRKVYMDGLA